MFCTWLNIPDTKYGNMWKIWLVKVVKFGRAAWNKDFRSGKTHSLIISREGLILTLSILPCPQGRIFWSTPCRKIDDERMSVLHQNSGVIGKSIPSALKISLDPRDFPREISRVSGNLLGVGDGFPNSSLVLVEHGYNRRYCWPGEISDLEVISLVCLWTYCRRRWLSPNQVCTIRCPANFGPRQSRRGKRWEWDACPPPSSPPRGGRHPASSSAGDNGFNPKRARKTTFFWFVYVHCALNILQMFSFLQPFL